MGSHMLLGWEEGHHRAESLQGEGEEEQNKKINLWTAAARAGKPRTHSEVFCSQTQAAA